MKIGGNVDGSDTGTEVGVACPTTNDIVSVCPTAPDPFPSQ